MGERNRGEKTIIVSSVGLFVFQVVTLVLSFVRSAVFAKQFGISVQADAFTAALQIPTVLFAFVGTAIKTITIPIYSKLLYGKSKEDADLFVSNLLNICLVFGIGITIVLVIFAKQITFVFCPGLSVETQILSSELMRIMSPSVALLAVSNVMTGVLNARKVFVVPQIINESALCIRIVAILVFARTWGVQACAIGYLVGTLMSTIILATTTFRYTKYSVYLSLKDSEIRNAGKQASSVIISTGTAEINRLIDKAIASFLPSGSISALGYALTLSTAISSLFITSVATIIFPVFAEKAAKRDLSALSDIYVKALSIFIHITVPLFAGALLMRTDIVRLVFGGGAFDDKAIEITSELFIFYFISILFSGMRQTSARLFYAQGDTKTPMKNSLIGIAINIILNIVLSRIMGAPGLALATAISTAIISVLLLISTKKNMKDVRYHDMWVACGKVIVSSVVMLIALFVMETTLPLTGMAQLLVMIASGALVYVLCLIILRSKELNWILQRVLRH